MAIQQRWLDKIAISAKEEIDHAVVTIDGVAHDHEIYRSTLEDNTLKTYVYVDNEQGRITETKLVDSEGFSLDSKQMQIEKGPDGFMIVFKVNLSIEGE